MGFDREVTYYYCGCYFEYLSHDFFNYQKDHRFVNVCGKHPDQRAAMENQKSPQTGGTEENREFTPFEKCDDITTSYDGRCFINLLGDVYVVAKEFNKKMLIHIRHYDERGQKKIPTKKGVTFNLSTWLLLERKKDDINNLFMKSLSGEEIETYTVHIGGGVHITVDPKFPTVDIRHFWKPLESDKPVPTRKGVALNRYKWSRLCDTIQVMREFVPELNTATVCYDSHPNDLEAISCKECYPFEEEEWKEFLPCPEDDNTQPLLIEDN